ncbi:MAG: hemerythrin domain-containing protein [Candidatus Sedimenticola sp. 20ELBAFRAG]
MKTGLNNGEPLQQKGAEIRDTAWRIEWPDALSMSNPEIDAEHQLFVRRVNELNSAIIARHEKAEVVALMQLILQEAAEHFAHEERLFAEKAFPEARDHTKKHEQLTQSFLQALNVIRQTELGREWIETGLTIRDLLVEHVLKEDTRYISYLRTV